MTNSLPPGKSVKWGRLILRGGVSVLVIAMALLWFAIKNDPASIIRFYYSVIYAINIGDGGILSGVPCTAPCVFGIRAGETQFIQVMPKLEKNGIASSVCLTEPNVSWYLFDCGVGRLNVQVDTQTQIVNAVWFRPNDSISLGEIIEKFGEPNYVTVDQEGAPGTIHPRCYWNSIRMLVTLPEISGKTYDIQKKTEVEGIQFSDKNLFRTSDKESDPYYKPWDGYGMYQPPIVTVPSIPMPTETLMP
ncbi:MAG: hypothetical protein PHQ40_14855 [Anaerolineaceae bacterium]|nr:hypothetical protein [Anaerolineaceae bacterium]